MSIPSEDQIKQISQNTIPVPQTQVQSGFEGFTLPFGNEQTAAAAKEAATPIAGGHSQNIPTSLQHQAPMQAGMAPLNNSPVVGKGNAKARGIGNAITGGLNAISGIVTAEANKKQAKVADAASIVFEAQKNIDDAQAQLRIDPNNQAAKDIIKQNQDRMSHLDPKMQKAILKGMQVDYTNPQKNKTSDHEAVAKAKADFQAKFADRVASGMPQGMAPNQQAVVKYQAMLEANKQAMEMQKAIAPALIRADAADREGIRKQMTEVLKQQLENTRADAKMKEEHAFRMQLLGTEQQNALLRIDAETAASAVRERQAQAIANSNPTQIAKLAGDSDREWASRTSSALNTLSQYETQIATLEANPDTASSEAVTSLRLAKGIAQEKYDSIVRSADTYHSFWAAQQSSLGIPIPEEKPHGTPAATTAPGPVASHNPSNLSLPSNLSIANKASGAAYLTPQTDTSNLPANAQ